MIWFHNIVEIARAWCNSIDEKSARSVSAVSFRINLCRATVRLIHRSNTETNCHDLIAACSYIVAEHEKQACVPGVMFRARTVILIDVNRPHYIFQTPSNMFSTAYETIRILARPAVEKLRTWKITFEVGIKEKKIKIFEKWKQQGNER